MRRVVVEPETVLSWFAADGPGADLRRDYEAGGFVAIAPRRLYGDLLARLSASGLDRSALASVAALLPRLGIQLQDPPLALVAGALARGRDPEAADYHALAESLDLRGA